MMARVGTVHARKEIAPLRGAASFPDQLTMMTCAGYPDRRIASGWGRDYAENKKKSRSTAEPN